ncbi:MAG TPA: hypothetical protein VJV79_17070 [Polyangiaceae bacterium]|nr:hypothetical protein [Polyangiaceae bacterium]
MASAGPAAAQVVDPPGEAPATPKVAPTAWPYKGGPVPAGYHIEERPQQGLIVGGTLTLVIPWALGVAAAGSSDFSNQSGWLLVPVLGPWINIAARKPELTCRFSGDACHVEADNSYRIVMIIDGLTQAAGAFMLVYGLASPKEVVTRDLVSRLHFTPAQMGKLGYGGVLSGEF